MNYNILTIPPFDKQLKRLAKKISFNKNRPNRINKTDTKRAR